MDRIDNIPKPLPMSLQAPRLPSQAAPSEAAATPADTFATAAAPTIVSPFAPATPQTATAAIPLPAFSTAAAASREVSTSTTARMLGIAGLALLAIGGIAAGSARAQTPPPMATIPSVPLPSFAQPGQMQPQGSNESFDDFIARMRAAKQQAQQQAPRPTQPDQPSNGGQSHTHVGVTVTAHGFYSGNKMVGVSNIRIAESGDYSNRTQQSFTNYSGSSTQGLRLDSGHPGKYYNVYVTWADGSSQTYNVRAGNSGARLDAWKY